MLKKSLYALVAVTALASPAFAQTATTSTTTTTTTSSSDQFVAKAQPGEWRASKFSGVSIYGPNKESVGKVSDVIMDKSGAAKIIVISVGGVMGVGSKSVGVPFNAVTWSDKPMEPETTSTIPGGATKAPSAPLAPPAGGTSTSASGSGSSMSASATPSVLDYPDYGTIKMTTDQLKAAPDFKYASEKAS